MHKIKNLIVGAGPSGLSLASLLPESVVLSRDSGGLLRNFEQDGFTFDLGGHVYTPHDIRVSALMARSGGIHHVNRRAFYSGAPAWSQETAIPYPVQYSMRDMIDPPSQPRLVVSLEDYLINMFGETFVDFFLRPFNERVWTAPIDKMDFDWISGRIQRPKEFGDGSKWGPNANFYYAPGSKIIDTLERDALCNGARIVEFDVERIDVKNKRVIGYSLTAFDQDVEYGGSTAVEYENLFVTIPYFVDEPSNLSLVVGIGFDGQLNENFHWMYPYISSIVHRVTLLSRYYPGLAPSGCDSLLLEIPIDPGRSMPDLAYAIVKSERSERHHFAMRLLHDAGFRRELPSIAAIWQRIMYAYPIPVIGARRRIAERKIDLLPHKVYLAGRWGAHCYFNLEHIFEDAHAVAGQSISKNPLEKYVNSSFYYKKEITK